MRRAKRVPGGVLASAFCAKTEVNATEQKRIHTKQALKHWISKPGFFGMWMARIVVGVIVGTFL
jgi:hypothetical protein